MQQNYDRRIFEKYAELLDRHLEVNEELRLFFEKHPDNLFCLPRQERFCVRLKLHIFLWYNQVDK